MSELLAPSKYNLDYSSWRPGQVEAITWLEAEKWLEEPREERQIKVLEAPTGTGKTGLILALAKRHPEYRFLVMCATKLEQEQYLKNLKDKDDITIASVKGKNNFHCIKIHKGGQIDQECLTSDCPLTHVDEGPCEAGGMCRFQKDQTCPYYLQKRVARDARVVVTNYAFGLSTLNYTSAIRGIGEFRVIVEDEGHVLDVELENFILIRLSNRTFKRLFYFDLPKYDSVAQWVGWVNDMKEEIAEAVSRYDEVNPDEMPKSEVRAAVLLERYEAYFSRIQTLDRDWVVEVDSSGVEFQPVWVTKDSQNVLFRHAKRHIIMSGTIPSASQLGKKVGLKGEDFEFLRLPYIFPAENRQIILRPRVSLSRDNLPRNLPVLVSELDELLEEFMSNGHDIKTLVHTKTYEITRYLLEHSSFKSLMLSHRTENRTAILEEFKQSSAPRILVSPSFDKAVDLPGDECELIVIAKVPYLYLGRKVMRKRVQKSRRYYLHETLMAIIQMAGRGVRSETDVCPTYILDSMGPSFFSQVKRMIPPGIKEAIVKAAEDDEDD